MARTISGATVALLSLTLSAIALTAVASCGGGSEASRVDSGASEVDAAPALDAPADAAIEAVAPTCDLGVLPTMPALASDVIIEGVDGGAAPTPSGGDETGRWIYTKITLYLPPQAEGQIDPAGSTIEGKGFIELGGGTFRQFVDTTTVLSTAAVGKVTRASSTKALGTYTRTGTAASFTMTCRESVGESTALGEIGFSLVDATHGRLHLTSTTQIGATKIVVDLEKLP